MKIAFYSSQSYDIKSFTEFKPANFELSFFADQLTTQTVKLCENHDAVCVFVNDQLGKECLEQLKAQNIKCVLLRCAGFNNVDLDTAQSLGIKVYRVPAYSPNAVAEHALALILTLNRKTHKAYNRVRENNFSLSGLKGFNLYGKKVGVIGAGKIGAVFCEIVRGFGCEVFYSDITKNKSLEAKNIRLMDLDQLVQKADIISLHCPLTPQTQYLFNEDRFSKMKPDAMLINTSRGALIDTSAAIKALKNGHLAYLGLDVYEQEEHLFFKDLSDQIIADDELSRLMTFPNVLITAHQGFFTDEAVQEIIRITFDNARAFIENKITDTALTN